MSNKTNIKQRAENDTGFTLIELMIVVVIVAILATIAVVAYQRQLRKGRLVSAREFVSRIQGRQETYFQQFGQYLDVSTADNFYPTLAAPEPKVKPWSTPSNEWKALGARPPESGTYFVYLVRASSGPNHTLNAIATALQIPPQPGGGMTPHPWYYVVAHGDLDGDSTYAAGGCSGATILAAAACTLLTTTSAQSSIITRNDGE